jgi:putative membrane protein
MRKLISQIVSAAIGLWLAATYVSGVEMTTFANSNFFGFSLTNSWQMFAALGFVLGVLNYFIGPLIKSIALPLEIITFGLFSLVINAGFVWFLDLTFDEFSAPWPWPLIWTTLIIWALNFVIAKILIKKDY